MLKFKILIQIEIRLCVEIELGLTFLLKKNTTN